MRTNIVSAARGRELFNQQAAKQGSGGKSTPPEVVWMKRHFPSFLEWLQANWDGETIVLPMPPNLVNVANQRSHWVVTRAIREEYFGLLHLVSAARLLPPVPHEPPRKVQAAVHFIVYNDLDPDNRVTRLKLVWDWMKRRGFIRDDADKYLTYEMPSQTLNRREPSRVEITLETMEV